MIAAITLIYLAAAGCIVYMIHNWNRKPTAELQRSNIIIDGNLSLDYTLLIESLVKLRHEYKMIDIKRSARRKFAQRKRISNPKQIKFQL